MPSVERAVQQSVCNHADPFLKLEAAKALANFVDGQKDKAICELRKSLDKAESRNRILREAIEDYLAKTGSAEMFHEKFLAAIARTEGR